MAKSKPHPAFDPAKMELAAEELRALLDYDKETGIFLWRNCADRSAAWNTLHPGKVAGYINKRLERRLIGLTVAGKKRRYYAGVLAWLYMTGAWPDHEVDHRNGVSRDDRWDNLRAADSSQNKWNSRKHSDNTSGYKGVSYDKNRGKYTAQIQARGHFVNLGRFDTLGAAHAAYTKAAADLHGKFARTA